MGEQFQLLLQFLLLALLEAPLVELLQLESDVLLVALVSRELRAQRLELCCYVAIVSVGLCVACLDVLVGAERVEHSYLKVLAVEQEVLVL